MNTFKHLGLIVGVLFLFLQLTSIVYARFIPERLFCWAPYDEHSYYEIKVSIEGKVLTKNEISKRYRYSSKGWEARSMDNIFSLVRQYEKTYGVNDNASVIIVYKTNGHKQKQWQP
ncbi:hypothetical protein [Winogradskyella sp. R77965]|uniref:hypothetical protein n=1 Tax=Winogradskyella sp. R77965 TaxID=3093872 RepID=UPI0037DD2FAE